MEPVTLGELLPFFLTLPQMTSIFFPSEKMAAGGACPGSHSQHSPPVELCISVWKVQSMPR